MMIFLHTSNFMAKNVDFIGFRKKSLKSTFFAMKFDTFKKVIILPLLRSRLFITLLALRSHIRELLRAPKDRSVCDYPEMTFFYSFLLFFSAHQPATLSGPKNGRF